MIDVLAFVLKYKFILLFYLLVVLFIAVKWKKIEKQAKIIFLYRTKFGLKWMDTYSQKFREWVILFGYMGIGVGFVGLLIISYTIIRMFIAIITQPEAVSGISPVLPGLAVPGLGVLSFWHWLLAIFLIALVHEFSHGIVARAHKVEVKNTGIVFFGPILGAFVEPNEKKLRKEKDTVQYSVLAAGSVSNIILALFAVFLLSFAFIPLQEKMVEPSGFSFGSYPEKNLPAEKSGLPPGTTIIGINDQKAANFQEFSDELAFYRPGETITVNTVDKDYPMVLAPHPDNSKKPYLGIFDIKNEFKVKDTYQSKTGTALYGILKWFNDFLRWLVLLSVGIGLFNLLPLPVVDGGRMLQVFLQKLKGEVRGNVYYSKIAWFFLLILVILLLDWVYPLNQLTKLF